MASNIINAKTISEEIMDDLITRFILDLPFEIMSNFIKLCFRVEQAHWFYLDHYVAEHLASACNFNQFAFQLFGSVPYLSRNVTNLNAILDEFESHKSALPVYGAILMTRDLDQVLLVETFSEHKTWWGFPKGKIDENEFPVDCAIREVREETGYDISNLIDPNVFIECSVKKYSRMYIVKNVPKEAIFLPETKNEIKSCKWFSLNGLPIYNKDKLNMNFTLNAISFHTVLLLKRFLKKDFASQSDS